MEVGAGMQTTYSRCSEIKFALQVLKDLKEISVNTFALASERVVSVSKQLSALRGKVTAKVHEGD